MVTFTGNAGLFMGNSPGAGLVSDGQGYLWGMTQYTANGTASHGTLFRIHELTGAFTRRVTFSNTTAPKGRVPQGALYYDGAGNLWGTTSLGGTYDDGTVFKYNIASNTLTTVVEFTGTQVDVGAIKGSVCQSALVPDGLGYLWGVTNDGGLASDNGTVFKVHMATNTATGVIEFSNNGATNKGMSPVGPLVNDGAGFLWGATTSGGIGNEGTVFKIEAATGTLTTVLQFGNLTGVNASIQSPAAGFTTDGQGYLWGIATAGGSASSWAVYKIKISDGSFTKVVEHLSSSAAYTGVSYLGRTPLAGVSGHASQPWLWGTTSVGGNNNLGTLYRFNPTTGEREVKIHFTGTAGVARGSKPNGKVYVDANGLVWGTTEEGGTSNVGTLFKYDPSFNTFTTLTSFVTTGGCRPKGSLIAPGDGYIWGTTSTGSSSSLGSVFKVDPITSNVIYVRTFSSADSVNGTEPLCGLAADASGHVWGSTQFGGPSNRGTLFKIQTSTGAFTSMLAFTGSSGAAVGHTPTGDLAVDASGNVWGTTATTVFKFEPGTSSFTNVFTTVDTSYPQRGVIGGTLTKAASGKLRFIGSEVTQDFTTYASPRVVIYEITPGTNAVSKLHSLAEGIVGPGTVPDFTPAGPLYEHSDGQWYGVNRTAGFNEDLEPAGGGMVYQVSTGPAVMTQPYNSTSVTSFYSLAANTTLTLRGYANPNGNAITCQIEWGPTTALGNVANASATPGTGYTGSLCEVVLTDLPAFTTYFYRIRANTQTGEPSYGPLRSIQTGPQNSVPAQAEIAVESPIGQPLTDGVTVVNMGDVLLGQMRKQAVVVRNLSSGAGTGELTGLTANITGTHASDFVISTPLGVSSLPFTEMSTGLLITFVPSGAGVRNAVLTITSNDADEASFEIPLTGQGVLLPEIAVESPNSTNLESGTASYDFGSGTVGVGQVRTFTVRNTGSGLLQTLQVNTSGPHAADFVVTAQPAEEVAAQGSTTFSVTFTPSASGSRSAVLSIGSNDEDENPFVIQVSGTGVSAPEIALANGVENLVSGISGVDFGSVNQGNLHAVTLTLRNVGNATLSNVSASIVGTHNADFFIGSLVTSVNAASEVNFAVTFNPQASGSRTATLRIVSNDGDENPFELTLNGTGVSVPEIAVTVGNDVSLEDGVSTLDFDLVATNGSLAKLITIRNLGTAALTDLSLSITGDQAAEYEAAPLTVTSLAPNGSTSFVLNFTPSASGVRTAILRLTSNDANENPFDIALTGTGYMPLTPSFTTPPASQIGFIGEPVSFAVDVVGEQPMSLQWRKNLVVIRNATSNEFNLPAVKASDVGIYSVFAENTLGEEISENAYLGLAVLRQGTLNFKVGAALTLKSTVSIPKAPGVSVGYQWKRSGQILEDGTTLTSSVISGAQSANLKVSNLQTGDTGNYTCVITMTTPTGTVEVADGDTVVNVLTLPVLTLPSLDPLFVSQPVPLIGLAASQNGAKFTAKGLPPGVKIDAVTGILTGAPTMAKIVKGQVQPYQIIFSATNVAGTVSSLPQAWIVEPLPPGIVGTFNGLVERNLTLNGVSGAEEGFGGTLQVVTNLAGSLTGKIKLGPNVYAFKGTLEYDPEAVKAMARATILRRSPAPALQLEFTVEPLSDLVHPGQLLGTVGIPGAEADIQAWRARADASQAGTYNVMYENTPALPETGAPSGIGHAILTVSARGTVSWSGLLSDGSKMTGATSMGTGGQVALHNLLYSNTGSVQGWVNLDSPTVTGSMDWLKNEQPEGKTQNYPAGFFHQMNVRGGIYTAPQKNQRVLGLSQDLFVETSNGGVTPALSYEAVLSTLNTLTITDSGEKFNLKINVKTGQLTGSFEQPGSKVRRASVYGLLVPGHAGVGFFLLPQAGTGSTPILSGSFSLSENSAP
ncbi:choice-of-anchor tandem repeat GloVer-containing protein [Prosthecobacter dejongeii]|uniref:Putative repeat protein (TIGR03803 family) n=1 Tax=Prosthecobacter dejongeii TaxID=48465 RepID=A0A7W7YMK8_9BACT|nr:choice-of-anchor tandem repeat GloVer-containing protein [Prosthecobacter dejongeii]MBB5038993.1 putative repeat protein (TIGR03803 family) [Prosthecobacter dejongeii]